MLTLKYYCRILCSFDFNQFYVYLRCVICKGGLVIANYVLFKSSQVVDYF